MRIKAVGRCNLHDAAEIHYDHAVAQVLDDAEIVSDQQQRESELVLEVLQQIDDLGLDRYVESRHRFVGHNEARRHRKSARNANALTLTT